MNNNKVLKAGAGLIFISLFGKIFGLLKQVIVAWAFGANGQTDIYFVADGAVAMIAVVVSGAISVTLLSYYSKKLSAPVSEKKALIGNVLSCGVIVSIIIVGLIIAFASPLSSLLAPSFTQAQHDQLSKYITFLSISVLIIISTSLCGAFLEGESDFMPAKLQNIFVSVTTIIIIVTLYKTLGIYALLFGYLGGYAIHYLFVAYRLNKKSLYCFSRPILSEDIKRLFRMAGLIIIGNSAVEFNHLIDKMIASGLSVGSVSALYYGQIVSTDLVAATLVYSISAIFIRDFSKQASEGNIEGVKNRVKTVIGYYFPLGVLLIIIYYFYSSDIIRVLLMRGSFDQAAADITRTVVLGYMFCFLAVPIKDILMKTHYAMLDSKRPMIICIVESGLNIGISFILSRQIGILGIALGTSISTLISCIIFRISIKKYLEGFRMFQMKQIIMVFIAAIAICGIKYVLDLTAISHYLIGRIGIALLLCLMYMALLLTFKYPYLDFVTNRISAIIRKGNK